MSLLVGLPLVPLAVALWLHGSPRTARNFGGRAIALVSLYPIMVALLAAPQHIEVSSLLIRGRSGLVLDPTARAALLLFGVLWLTAGLMLARNHPPVRLAALLITFSATMALAIAQGGALIYTGMIAGGYGLYAILAGEHGDGWRRGGRTLIVLLVLSDLLIFELLLESAAKPEHAAGAGLLVIGLAALLLRGGVPPAHVWLPSVLPSVSAPTALLLIGVLPGAAYFGGLKLLPAGGTHLVIPCTVFGLAAAGWSVAAGLAQRQPRASLGYALAATATLLLVTIPARGGTAEALPWLGLALLGCCAACALIADQKVGWRRNALVSSILLIHGIAGGLAAQHVASAVPGRAGILAAAIAVSATLLLTVAARAIPSVERSGKPVPNAGLASLPVVLAATGLGIAWTMAPPAFAFTWVAPVGVVLGLVAHRLKPAGTKRHSLSADLLRPAERAFGTLHRRLHAFCLNGLPRISRQLVAGLLRLWNGEAGSRWTRRAEFALRAWPATSLMLIAVALAAAFLLAR